MRTRQGVFNTLGLDPSATLAYATGLEHLRQTMIIIRGHGG